MSSIGMTGSGRATTHGNGHGNEMHPDVGGLQQVSHQFEDLDQQNESYIVGMWTFLVTEIMFFGAIFAAYFIYRSLYLPSFHDAHLHLSRLWGTINTFVLLASSMSMALAVHYAQEGRKLAQILALGFTLLCAFAFLGVKVIEYGDKIHHNLVPGVNFRYTSAGHDSPAQEIAGGGGAGHLSGGHAEGTNAPQGPQAGPLSEPAGPGQSPQQAGVGFNAVRASDGLVQDNKAELFFGFYFAMTGLHGLHIVIGILLIGTIMLMRLRNHPAVEDYMPTELVGLYWHFVDIVWIFLFPFLYLVG